MALFNWGKKEADKTSSETLLSYEEEIKKLRKAHEEAFMAKMYRPTATTTTTGGSVPFGAAAAMGAAASAAHAMYGSRGASIKLGDLRLTYDMEPYAMIKLVGYFAKLGIKTEEDAVKLIEELNSV